MVNNLFNKKGQGLPLNTIVIAILVIIVLLVIVVFFTTNISEQGETLGETTDNLQNTCDASNPVLSNYDNTDIGNFIEGTNGEAGTCEDAGFSKVPGLNCCVNNN